MYFYPARRVQNAARLKRPDSFEILARAQPEQKI